MTEVNQTTRSSLFEAIVAGAWTSETLPKILTEEQRAIYQQAADALERRAFPPSQEFHSQEWRMWLTTPGGRLCTAITHFVLG